MLFMSRVLYILALITTLLAGCVNAPSSGGGGGSSAGLEITYFDVTPKEIYEDEGVDIFVTIENIGDKQLFGDSKLWIYGPSYEEWSGEGEMADAFSLSGLTINTRNMYKGEQREVTGSLYYIGDVQAGTYKQYDIYARLCYPYSTTFTGNFIVVSRDEARLNKKQGTLYDVLSSGPVGIDFMRKDRTITGNAVRGSVSISGSGSVGGIRLRIDADYRTGEGSTVRYVSLPIEIYNRGSGFPTLPADCSLGPNVDYENRGYVAVQVLLNGYDITQSCFPAEDTREVNLVFDDGSVRASMVGIVKLRKDGNTFTRGRISCKIKDIDFDTPNQQHTLDVIAYYDYYVDRFSTVRVKSLEDLV